MVVPQPTSQSLIESEKRKVSCSAPLNPWTNHITKEDEMSELIEIFRRHFGPGSGFENEDPSSCVFFSLALSFEDDGEAKKAADMLRLAVADETVCGLRGCWNCDELY